MTIYTTFNISNGNIYMAYKGTSARMAYSVKSNNSKVYKFKSEDHLDCFLRILEDTE